MIYTSHVNHYATCNYNFNFDYNRNILSVRCSWMSAAQSSQPPTRKCVKRRASCRSATHNSQFAAVNCRRPNAIWLCAPFRRSNSWVRSAAQPPIWASRLSTLRSRSFFLSCRRHRRLRLHLRRRKRTQTFLSTLPTLRQLSVAVALPSQIDTRKHRISAIRVHFQGAFPTQSSQGTTSPLPADQCALLTWSQIDSTLNKRTQSLTRLGFFSFWCFYSCFFGAFCVNLFITAIESIWIIRS